MTLEDVRRLRIRSLAGVLVDWGIVISNHPAAATRILKARLDQLRFIIIAPQDEYGLHQWQLDRIQDDIDIDGPHAYFISALQQLLFVLQAARRHCRPPACINLVTEPPYTQTTSQHLLLSGPDRSPPSSTTLKHESHNHTIPQPDPAFLPVCIIFKTQSLLPPPPHTK